MSLPRFFHKRGAQLRGGGVVVCIFVFSYKFSGERKTMICLKNWKNNNSLSEQFLPWPHARASSPPLLEGGRGALHLAVECAIPFRIISENQQLYGMKNT